MAQTHVPRLLFLGDPNLKTNKSNTNQTNMQGVLNHFRASTPVRSAQCVDAQPETMEIDGDVLTPVEQIRIESPISEHSGCNNQAKDGEGKGMDASVGLDSVEAAAESVETVSSISEHSGCSNQAKEGESKDAKAAHCEASASVESPRSCRYSELGVLMLWVF